MVRVAAEKKHKGYADVVAELERRIDSGALGVGALLPSEPDLVTEFGVARNTVRRALEQLRQRGRIHTVKGRGTVVRPPSPVRLISNQRYRDDLETAASSTYPPVPLGNDPALEPHRPVVDLTEVPAGPELAALFGVPEGTMLSRRHIVHRVGGHPIQIVTSYYLLDMVAGTWVVTPESEPSPGGTIGHLWSVDARVAEVRDEIEARLPTTDEARTLRINATDSVVATTQQMLTADGRVVAVAREIVAPSNGYRMEYVTKL